MRSDIATQRSARRSSPRSPQRATAQRSARLELHVRRRNRLTAARTDCIAGPLLTRLLSEPLVEHGAREADVPADPMAGQAAGPHGLVNPARPDVEIPSGLIWTKQPILLQRSLCCWCCCFHADIDPNAAEPANGFFPSNARPPHDLACQHGRRDAPKPAPATAGRPLGKGVGKDGLPSQTRDRLPFAPFAGVFVMGPAGLEPATYRL